MVDTDGQEDANLQDPENIEDDDDEDDNDEDEDPLARLPPNVIPRVQKLNGLNDQRDKIMQDYLAERACLEEKYAKILNPLYAERASILKGEQDEAIAAAAKEAQAQTEADVSGEADAEEIIVGIPQFWITVISQEDDIAEQVTEADVDCLAHLENIEVEDYSDGKGFLLRFHFAPNEYFEDAVLVKKYTVPNLLLSDEPVLKNVEGCKIQWKEGKSLTHRTVQKKQRGKGKNAGQIRTVTKTEKIESFFNWFDPPPMPKIDDLDEEEAEELEEYFDSDYEIAQAFRSHIIPQAVLWFTGEIMEQETLAALEES